MMGVLQRITPHLWFDTKAEDAARYYASIFPKSKVENITYYTEEGREIHGKDKEEVMTVEFSLEGQSFLALNGGPQFSFSPAISFLVHCKNQQEIDYYWEQLVTGGNEDAQQCGWLEDKFGVSWQVVPERLNELLAHDDEAVVREVTKEMLQMKKIDLQILEAARERMEH